MRNREILLIIKMMMMEAVITLIVMVMEVKMTLMLREVAIKMSMISVTAMRPWGTTKMMVVKTIPNC